MKTCNRCGQERIETDFHKHSGHKDGLRPRCKYCIKEIAADYYLLNKIKIDLRNKSYAEEHKEECDQYFKEYRRKNKHKISEYHKKSYREDKEKKLKIGRDFYAKNAKKILERCKRYKNLNKDRVVAWGQTRRFKKESGKLSSDIRKILFMKQGGLCACCGLPLGDKYHIDHIMPLALGGTNTDDNVQLLRSWCNLSKGSKHPDDYMQIRKKQLNV